MMGKAIGERTGMSRRAALGLGAAAVAVAAVPAALYARWIAPGFVRAGYEPEPPPAPPGRVEWSNWSGAVRATPRSIAVAKDEAAVARIVTSSPGPIRPVGSGHSFVALAPSEGTMLDVSPLAGVVSEDPAAGTVTFGAGTRLQHAARLLAERGLAFPNLSDIDTQTLAGLFSTSTHGTGLTLKALHGVIDGFRMVTAAGETRDVTAASDPDLFAAGKVSLGALGVMTAYTIRPVKAFNLRRRVTAADIEAIYPEIDALAHTHRNFEIYYLPGIGKAAIITHDLHEGEVAGRADSSDDDILQGLKTLRDQLGWWPWLRRMVAVAELPHGVIEDSTDESWKMLATGRPTKFNEMEYEMPIEAGKAALPEVVAAADSHPRLYFPIEVRFVAADDAWLSPFTDGPRMSISVHAAADEDADVFFSLYEPIFRAHGGRPHWGKMHSLKARELQAIHPHFDAFGALRARLDPQGVFLNPYLKSILGV